MGTDIHFVVEKKVDERWLGLFDSSHCDGLANDRDYGLFGELAGIRCRGSQGRKPRGVPDDASDLTKYHIADDGPDGHSHSFMSMSEFAESARHVDVVRKDEPVFTDDFGRKNPVKALFDIYIEEEFGENDGSNSVDKYRVVFWFDN